MSSAAGFRGTNSDIVSVIRSGLDKQQTYALLLGVELVLDFLPLERGIELDFVVLVACLTVVVVVALS